MNKAILQLADISHSYHQGDASLDILRDVNLDLGAGEMVALVAPSGAGKSTLLHIAGLLESPSGGRVIIDGQDCSGLADRKRAAIRCEKIGFVYQYHHLLPEFSAVENIMLPQMIQNKPIAACKKGALGMLEKVGLANRAAHRPAQLSGGEQQRVAILRALANNPKILLADEPTGNLDAATGDIVFDMLFKLVRESGMTALIATHNADLAGKMDRVINIKNGTISNSYAPYPH